MGLEKIVPTRDCGPQSAILTLVPPLHRAIAALCVLSCQPSVDLGQDERPGTGGSPAAEGGADGTDEDPRLISSAGASGTDEGLDPLQEPQHDCSLSYPGESHPQPITVCCSTPAQHSTWHDEALVFINVVRTENGVPPVERDPILDQAAMGWVLHWSLHWDPVRNDGYPDRSYGPNVVAEACGTTASLLMATDAQDEPVDDEGLFDPEFPARYWATDGNLSGHFFDPSYDRLGLATHEGLLVSIWGRGPAP